MVVWICQITLRFDAALRDVAQEKERANTNQEDLKLVQRKYADLRLNAESTEEMFRQQKIQLQRNKLVRL